MSVVVCLKGPSILIKVVICELIVKRIAERDSSERIGFCVVPENKRKEFNGQL